MTWTGGIADDAWALTGHDAERHVIVKRLGEGAPHCIVITGDRGVGRTRLAREALAAARDAGWRALWATGTRAAAAVPLGAMAHLVPPADSARDPFTLLQRAMSAIDDDGGRPLVLVIDDAHLLDELSQTLVQQLAASSTVSLVITMRTGSAPGLAALFRDGSAERLDLHPLEREHSDRLVVAGLGGEVESRTCERLWRLTRGNPLFLRELVESGRSSGQLRRRDGFWRWEGRMHPPPRLMEIVDAQLEGTDNAERAALEVLAVGEELALERLVGMSGTAAVAGLERLGLAVVDGTGPHAQVRVTHPLYAEVVRAKMPEAAAIRVRQQLADDTALSTSQDGLLRAGRLAVDSAASDVDVGLLTDAAGSANVNLDHPLAERLARAAVEAGGGFDAHLALFEALQWQGRPAEADTVAAAALRTAVSNDERARLVAMRALNRFCGLRTALDSQAELRDLAATGSASRSCDELNAALALIAFLGGRPRTAVDLGTDVHSGSTGPTWARSLGAAAAAGGLAVRGRPREALGVVESGWAAATGDPPETEAAFVRLAMAQAELLALWLAGRLPELESRAAELHRQSLMAPEWAGDAVAAMHIGWAALGRGHLPAATRWLAEAMSGFGRRDPMGLLPLCAAQLAQARGLLGDTAGAAEALAPIDDDRSPMRAFEPQILLGRAWATTDRRQAVATALRAAHVAADLEQWAIEAMVLQAVVQLGLPEEAAGRLRQLAAQFDVDIVSIYADHAEAAAAGSGGGLDSVTAGYERGGALLAAADASAQAAAAHRRAGDQRKASAAAVKAARLARACGRARTPALVQLSMPRLTSREAEVARYASAGCNNHEIADRLVLSVRTVEAHLANIYTKLGITSRTHLRDALAVAAPGAESQVSTSA